MMEDHNFYQVQGWMLNNLKLKGNELICYAIIFSFSQDEKSQYMGGVKYLQGWMNVSEQTVISTLEKLTQKGLIEPQSVITNTCKRVYYRVTKDSLVRGNSKKLSKVTKETLPSLYNNNNNNIDNNKEKKEKETFSKKRFVKPTIQEIEAYIKEKGYHFDAEQFFYYYESKGWLVGKSPMKNWKAACTTWEGMRKQQIEDKEEPIDEIPADDVEKWGMSQVWMKNNTPRIASKVTYKDFAKMRAMVLFRAKPYAAILKAIDRSDYDGDIAKEFERLTDTEEFSKMITE